MKLTDTTFTRQSPLDRRSYLSREAHRLLAAYPHADSVRLAEYGGCGKNPDLRADAGPTAIVYVRSRQGAKMARSRRILIPHAAVAA